MANFILFALFTLVNLVSTIGLACSTCQPDMPQRTLNTYAASIIVLSAMPLVFVGSFLLFAYFRKKRPKPLEPTE